MRMMRLAAFSAVLVCAGSALADIVLKDASLDRPVVLDTDTNYFLRNVNITNLTDAAALTLAGRVNSVTLENCNLGRIVAGPEGKAAAMECSGAVVGRFTATNTSFFDAENQLATLREGTFGTVTFDRCHFSTSDRCLKEVQQKYPWRNWAPVTEFYNIERLELLDNDFTNTVIIIHPSVKKVVVRGQIPGLIIQNPHATKVIQVARDGEDA
ncbi:MAG: hypothetical protein ABSH20_15360 [Tepidisphaeraceae bacterium]